MSTLAVMFLVLIWLLNFGISWWNAKAVGSAWAYGKTAGFGVKLLLWSGATMSACGFTWCYLIPLALLAGAFNVLPWEYVYGALDLGYIIIIGPVLASGFVIMIHSWKRAWEERSFLNYGVAGWNTFAQIHNTVRAIQTVPVAFDGVSKLLKGGDGKDKAKVMMVVLVVLCLVGGIATTVVLIRSAARNNAEAIYDRIRGLEKTQV